MPLFMIVYLLMIVCQIKRNTSSKTSCAVFQSRHFLGQLLIKWCALFNYKLDTLSKFVCLGKNSLSRQFPFSLLTRYQEE